MSTDLNNAEAKAKLQETLQKASEKADKERWFLTEEGKFYLLQEEMKWVQKKARAEFAIGQLVWKDVLDCSDQKDDPSSLPVLASRCSKIVKIEEGTVITEMLYIVVNGERRDSYVDWHSIEWLKGAQFEESFYLLKKHISKNKNVWWKVNQ